jgi:intracellular sulfur oxidation DsrE/DsrF family protein
MHRFIILAVIAAALLAFVYSDRLGLDSISQPAGESPDMRDTSVPDSEPALPGRAVLDITVHTIEELHVLLDRAEELAVAPRTDDQDASVVLVLHGPEVEFFSTRNYDRYKDIVDQAARLDTYDIVDVRICQTMMAAKGISRDDIPSFIEQVPNGGVEVERLQREGYVYF